MTTRKEISTEHICSLGVSRYKKGSDITEGDITGVRVQCICLESRD